MRKALKHLRTADPTMAGIIARVGPYRMQYREPEFSTLVRSIVYQQLSGKAAGTILRRLEEACGDEGFTPERILRLRAPQMRKVGVSQQKQDYLRDLAKRTQSGLIDFAGLAHQTDEEVIEHLTAVKGIGVWTVHMFLMFALRRPDVLPTGDLGVRNAIHRAYNLSNPPKPAEIEQTGECWRPWRSVATWYLWRSLDGEAAI